MRLAPAALAPLLARSLAAPAAPTPARCCFLVVTAAALALVGGCASAPQAGAPAPLVAPASSAPPEAPAAPAAPSPEASAAPAASASAGALRPETREQPPAPGENLSAALVRDVVDRNRYSLKRLCLAPALTARSALSASPAQKPAPGAAAPPTTTTTVMTSVLLTIGADGRVRAASASGGDELPGFSRCVATSVRGWVFPASDGVTTVNVPFAFVLE